MEHSRTSRPSPHSQPEGFKNPQFHSRNCSPPAHTIKSSLLSSLKQYTKSYRSPILSKPNLISLLKQLNFLNSDLHTTQEYADISYMWKLISKDSQTTIYDAISYLLCVLDFAVPSNLIQNSLVFKNLPSNDFEYIKRNSLGFLRNYLEKVYVMTTKDCGNVMKDVNHWGSKARTPKTTNPSRAETPKMAEVKRKSSGMEKKVSPRVPRCSSGVKIVRRLKRSESNSRCHSKEQSGVFVSDFKNQPLIGIEVNNPSGKSKNLILYIKI